MPQTGIAANWQAEIQQFIESWFHINPGRGYRAGEMFYRMPEPLKATFRSPSGLARYLLANLETFELDEIVVYFPEGGQGPKDGLKSVFFSSRDFPEEKPLGKAHGLPSQAGLSQ